MVYGSHLKDGSFQIFAAISKDGVKWTNCFETPFFGISTNKSNFDGRYVSTPRVIVEKKRLILYYSSRDWSNVFIDLNNKKWYDSAGFYTHIGVAYVEY